MQPKRNPIAKALRSPHLQPKVIADKRRKAARAKLGLADDECFDCGHGSCFMNCGPATDPETNEVAGE